MKLSVITIVFYLFLSVSSYAEIEPITNVCNESSFLSCVSKNKQECINSFNLSASYCAKKHPFNFNEDNTKLKKTMRAHMKCMQESLHSYYDNDRGKFAKCLTETKYAKKLEQTMSKEIKK